MTLDEARIQLRRQLEETYGVDGAHILLDQPPGGWSNLVTNDTLRLEIAALRNELKGDGAALRNELKGDIAALRHELKGDIAALRHELKGDLADLRAAMHEEMKAQTWRLITAMIALIGILGGMFLTVSRG